MKYMYKIRGGGCQKTLCKTTPIVDVVYLVSWSTCFPLLILLLVVDTHCTRVHTNNRTTGYIRMLILRPDIHKFTANLTLF